MGDLTNKQIDLTYDGLIKTSDENPIDGTLKNLQDGVGNNLPMQVSTTGVNFTGTVTGIPASTDTTYDLDAIDAAPNATVRLSGSDATTDDVNLIAGTNVSLDVSQNNITINSTGGTDTNTTYDLDFVPDGQTATIELNGSDLTTDVISIVPGNNVTFDLATPGQFTINAAGSSPSLVSDSNTTFTSTIGPSPAVSSAVNSIVIGNNVNVSGGNNGVIIGHDINVNAEGSVVVGRGASNGDIYGTAVGADATGGYFGLALGNGAVANTYSCAVGADSRTETDYGIAIGFGAQSRAQYNITMGVNALIDDAVRVNTVVIGSGAGQTKAAQYSTAVGSQSIAVGDFASAFGYQSAANFSGSTALGANTQAVANDTVTVKRLHWQDWSSVNFADDGTASANGIPLGGLYHNNGAVQIRIV